MRSSLFLFSIIAYLLVGLNGCDQEDVKSRARAKLVSINATSDSTYLPGTEEIGEAVFTDLGDRVRVFIQLYDMIPNWGHAVHIHNGSCEQPTNHWNMGDTINYCNEMNLGEPWMRPKAGDIGNVETDDFGDGILIVESEFWDLNGSSEKNLEGLVVVIHEKPEDFEIECGEMHTHKHNNRKLACGTIFLDAND